MDNADATDIADYRLLAAVTLVAVVLPSTTAVLHWPARFRRSDEPPATEQPGN